MGLFSTKKIKIPTPQKEVVTVLESWTVRWRSRDGEYTPSVRIGHLPHLSLFKTPGTASNYFTSYYWGMEKVAMIYQKLLPQYAESLQDYSLQKIKQMLKNNNGLLDLHTAFSFADGTQIINGFLVKDYPSVLGVELNQEYMDLAKIRVANLHQFATDMRKLAKEHNVAIMVGHTKIDNNE